VSKSSIVPKLNVNGRKQGCFFSPTSVVEDRQTTRHDAHTAWHIEHANTLDVVMWIFLMTSFALAQSTNVPARTPSIHDAQTLAEQCTGPTSCDFGCWDAAVRLLEPTEQGGVRMACYSKGESHGPIVSWHPNGRKEGVGFNAMGTPVGGYVAWHPNGKAAATGQWVAGQLHGTLTTWHANGTLESQGVWDQGVQTGMVRYWHDNGQLEEVGTWRNRQPEGPIFSWYADGTRKRRANYQDGVAHGTWKEWYPNGKRQTVGRFHAGETLSMRCWESTGKQMICPKPEKTTDSAPRAPEK